MLTMMIAEDTHLANATLGAPLKKIRHHQLVVQCARAVQSGSAVDGTAVNETLLSPTQEVPDQNDLDWETIPKPFPFFGLCHQHNTDSLKKLLKIFSK